MKSLLIMLLISICAIAWRSEDIKQALGAAQRPVQPVTVEALAAGAARQGHKPMTIAEFQELSKTDPQAYQKLINSLRVEEEHSEVDKLMNWLAHGKYE